MGDTFIRVGIVGAAGRMGQRLMHVLATTEHMTLSAVLAHTSPVTVPPGMHPLVTRERDAFVQAADVIIDFSAPAAVDQVATACVAHGVAYLIASTALSEGQQQVVQQASKSLPVLVAANLSVGIAALGVLVQDAVARLQDFDVEIVETHHRHKRDAPSGTALYLVEQAQKARHALREHTGRASHDATRSVDEIGVHAVRGGDVAGEHQVLLLGDGERLELTHRSHDGFVFARGAIRAATWLVEQSPGLYSMQDVVRGRC